MTLALTMNNGDLLTVAYQAGEVVITVTEDGSIDGGGEIHLDHEQASRVGEALMRAEAMALRDQLADAERTIRALLVTS